MCDICYVIDSFLPRLTCSVFVIYISVTPNSCQCDILCCKLLAQDFTYLSRLLLSNFWCNLLLYKLLMHDITYSSRIVGVTYRSVVSISFFISIFSYLRSLFSKILTFVIHTLYVRNISFCLFRFILYLKFSVSNGNKCCLFDEIIF